jgi:serine/threonine-protein kinase SRPK3
MLTKTPLEGELRHINKLRFWPLEDVLHDKYEFTREIAQTIASFLSPMLRLNPEKRAGAGELVHHRWLDGTVVQGEIDVIRRAEEEEARRRQPSSSSSSTGSGLSHFGAGPDLDALKPVDDDPHTTDDERPSGASGTSGGGASGTSGVNAPPTLQMPRPASATAKENLKQALAKQQQQQAASTSASASGSQSRKRS